MIYSIKLLSYLDTIGYFKKNDVAVLYLNASIYKTPETTSFPIKVMKNVRGQLKCVVRRIKKKFEDHIHKPSIFQNYPSSSFQLVPNHSGSDHLSITHGHIATHTRCLDSAPLLFVLLS